MTKLADTRDGLCDADCSLREAVIASNQHAGLDNLVLGASTYVLLQAGPNEENALSGDLDVTDDLIISGVSSESTVIDGNGTDRIFDTHGLVSVKVEKLTLLGGSATEGGALRIGVDSTVDLSLVALRDNDGHKGGAVYCSGVATLKDCELDSNKAKEKGEELGNGAAVFNAGEMTIESTTFHENRGVSGRGGAIGNEGNLQVFGSDFSNNDGNLYGGILWNNGTAELNDCVVVDNTASRGGAIDNAALGELKLSGCSISDNFADFDGGAIRNAGTIRMEDCDLVRNTTPPNVFSSTTRGGAIFNEGEIEAVNLTFTGSRADNGGVVYNTGTFESDSSIFHDNGVPSADNVVRGGFGGVIYNTGVVRLNDSKFYDNLGDVSGGVLYSTGEATISDCTFGPANESAFGGAASLSSEGSAVIVTSTFLGNVAAIDGGAIDNRGELDLSNSTFDGNTAAGKGGAIINGWNGYGGEASITNCTLSRNKSATNRGAVHNESGGIVFANSIIAEAVQGRSCTGKLGPSGLTSSGHNLDDDGGCGFFSAGDLSIVPAYLGALANHGGPTLTVSLCTGQGQPDANCLGLSPAIDGADDALCGDLDQRGAERPQGLHCDIGAYENGAQQGLCGDANGDGEVSASDALRVLRRSVGLSVECPESVCDVDGSGQVQTSDALRVLRKATGQSVVMNCPNAS